MNYNNKSQQTNLNCIPNMGAGFVDDPTRDLKLINL